MAVAQEILPRLVYYYTWHNNKRRRSLYGRKCRVIDRPENQKATVKFLDNGQIETVTYTALKKSLYKNE